MPFEWFLAMRFLREGRGQTVLIIVGVGVGVAVMIFLTALITGLQATLIKQTLGIQAHVVVRPPEELARPVFSRDDDVRYSARIERPAQRIRSIDGWQELAASLARTPGVEAVSPMVSGPAFATRGVASQSVALLGADAQAFNRVIPLAERVVAGAYQLGGTDAIIGVELAKDLGLGVGDKLRLVAADGRAEVFGITALFDVGNRDVNRRWVLVPLRAAQTLLGLPGGCSNIDVRVRDLFAADAVADELARRTGLVADSWQKTNAQLLIALSSQSQSSNMIQVFVALAVAMGIASVLAVSVVQKSREIGILRAMGASASRVLRVFLLEGAVVGLAGSAIGLGLGTILALIFERSAVSPDGSPTFPVLLTLGLYARAVGIATLVGIASAALPARRAARLEPVAAIRHV